MLQILEIVAIERFMRIRIRKKKLDMTLEDQASQAGRAKIIGIDIILLVKTKVTCT
ncbi:hypothetical protein D3C86_1991910 [compost metagenome]